jgi:hypothetical protein
VLMAGSLASQSCNYCGLLNCRHICWESHGSSSCAMRLDRPCFINKSTTALISAIRSSCTSMLPGAWSSSNILCFLAFSMDLRQQARAVIASFLLAGSSDRMDTIMNSSCKVRRVTLYLVILGSCRVATNNLGHLSVRSNCAAVAAQLWRHQTAVHPAWPAPSPTGPCL